MTDNLASRIANLSPEKRALLEKLLKQRGVDLNQSLIIPVKRDGSPLPLSFAQQRLWFLDQLEPNSPIYNIPTAVRLSGKLDVGALDATLDALVQRHESLRTTFSEHAGSPVQVIAPQVSLPLVCVDLTGLPVASREAEAMRLAMEEARKPFNLAEGPLLRATLLRLDEAEHILLLTMHHIISDGWSMGVLVREMAALYQAFAAGQPSPLPELPIQYADYAHWQREWLQGEVLEKQLAYWRERLGDEPPVLELPTDRPRPATQTWNGASLAATLPRNLADGLKALAKQEGATLFMVLLAALQTLLYRYSGQTDISIGTPVAGRRRAELENLIGFFVNTLVMRTDLSGQPTFRELLGRVKEVALGAFEHQDVPFEMLVEKLQPERDMSRSPFFQVMFVLQNAPAQALRSPELTIEELDVDSGTAQFDLTFSVADLPAGLSVSVEYNTDLFDEATVRRMLGHFEVLLRAAAADPDTRITDLPLLTEAEERQILVEWNQTDAPYPADQCAHELFEAQAARTPDAVALVFEGETMSYAELNRRANQLAHTLQARGVGPETLVGLCVERSFEMIIGILGVLKAGGAYLPLDPTFPPERLAFMLEDAGVDLVLTQSGLADRLPAHPAERLYLDADWPEIARQSTENPQSGAAPGNLAYVIYTSGSTGRPKGVLLAHRGLVNLISAYCARFGLKPGVRFLQFSTVGFDGSVPEVFATLASGATLVLGRRETLLSPSELHALLRRERVNVATLPPALLSVLPADDLPDLEHVMSVGDRLTGEVAAKWKPGRHLHNGYGPTENTVCSVWHEVTDEDIHLNRYPIGRPFPNVRAYVLDAQLRPVPVGVPGELCVGGVALARGYLNRPELTAERFIADPFGAGGRLYRTGDRVRWLPDGTLEFLGRLDQQVKVRGFRVELGEIEAVLVSHPTVEQAAVKALGESPAETWLAAYIVPASGATPDPAALRAYLVERLPDYMVPTAYVVMDALPLNASGKVDRKALPAPEGAQLASAEYVAPRTPVEAGLAAIYASVLKVERVGVHDDFFALGGHSLLATQLVSRVRQAFNVDLPLRTLFQHSTVERLAKEIEQLQRAAAGLESPPIERIPREGNLPLSFAQQRLWFLDQFKPNSAVYNIPTAVRLRGELDAAVLEQALNEIVRRHEVLRTSFPTVEGRPAQVIAPEFKLRLPCIDLTGLPEDEREAEAMRLAEREAQRPFDLAHGPLLRGKLFRLAADDHLAVLVTHHIISDGWSGGVLARELAALYEAFSAGEPSPLPDLPIQYADYAHWQRKWLQGDVLERQLAYWRQQLEGAPALLELPTDRPRPAVQSTNGAYVTFELPGALSDRVRELSRREGATLFMTLLAAFQTLLYRYSGQTDICVGTPIAGRNHAELEGLIGFFVNTLVMRADLSGEPSFRDLLRQVREVALGAYAHQDVPFEMLVDELQPERNTGHTPLFQVMFVLQNAPHGEIELPGLTLSTLDLQTGVARFDLTLAMIDVPGALAGAVEYSSDLFDEATIRRMVGHFERLLAAAVADPDRPISRLPLLTDAERHTLLVEWNDTKADVPSDRCAHELFEEQAARTPEAIAARCGEETLTYAELNRRANQLAHALRRRGVGPEMLVAIAATRSLEMVVGLLGVLKAGGAYLPIDPTYPRERIAFMLEDAGVRTLLTQAALLERLPAHRAETICLDTDWPEIARESTENPQSGVKPGNLAYVIYTSGSTGKPKGAMIEHRGLVNYLAWCQRAYPLRQGSGAPVHSSISFDLTITGLFAPLTVGSCVTLLPEGNEVEALSEALRTSQEAFSLVKITPAHLELVSQQLGPQEATDRTHAFIIGGEALHYEQLRFWQRYAPGTALINEYGPTETVVGCCVYVAPPRGGSGSVPIGRPIINTRLYILDAHGEPVPVGVPGELYIGGAGVARGYLNRPDLTAERFLPDPFSDEPGARMYRTGDLCRWLPDGNIDFLGRIDHQVKVRGFRIELGEIEAVLGEHPAVKEAVVLAREDEPGHKRLVGYVVADGEPPSVSALREYLGRNLPDYMVPSAFVFLDALPLTPNGKVDRAALPAPSGERPELESEFVAARDEVEAQLAAIWAEVLGLEKVGVHDNFFELGGDSILSIQVIARANQAGLRLSPRQLFQHPTVAGLASVAGRGPAVQTEQGLVEGPVPLTPIQHWFFEQEIPNRHHWNQSLLLEVKGQLNGEALKQAVGALLRHHDALRLRFRHGPAGWEQENSCDENGMAFRSIDLSRVADSEITTMIETTTATLQASLNLNTGPLVRIVYFDCGPHRSGRLLFVVHHLAVDGVSWRVLLEDFQTAYAQISAGQPVQLPPKTTSFKYWAQRLENYAQSAEVREELAYWHALAERPARPLPVDFPGGENRERRAHTIGVALTEAETEALLRDVPAAYRTEINEVLLTALAVALSEWTGDTRVLIDLEGHGREDLFEDVDLSRTVGWFTTLYPVMLDLAGAQGIGEQVKAVKEQLRAVPRRGIGYGLLRYLSEDDEVRARLANVPQPQIAFNYLGQFDQMLGGANGDANSFGPAPEPRGPERDPNGLRRYLIEINGGVSQGCLRLEWTYSRALYQQETIERVARAFIDTLRGIIEHSRAPEAASLTPSDFPLADLDQKKLDKLLSKLK